LANPNQKILFLAPYPFGRVASQRFRFEQYWDLLPSWGISASFQSFYNPSDFAILYKKGHYFLKIAAVFKGFLRRLYGLSQVHRFDKIVVHREITPLGPPVFEYLISQWWGKKIVYDFDDAIWLSNTSSENRLSSSFKCHWKVSCLCKWAWKVSCGNHFLQEYAKRYQKEVFYTPTTLDLDAISSAKSHSSHPDFTIGWTGTHSTLKYLENILPLLQSLEAQFDFTFLVIADKDPQLELKNYQFIRWQKATEWEDLSQLDLGLMPLDHSPWEEGKCGFKALQYMSLGIPVILSPTGANRRIVENGETGFVCASMEEWREAIIRLKKDVFLREKFAKKGAERVRDHYSKRAWQSHYQALFS
jgi:glycosyltransferase involved in cell wall biosynthesis